MTRLIRAMLAALVLSALVVGVPVLLVATIGNPVPAGWRWSGQLTNEAVLGVLACVAWVLWAQLTACVAIELTAEVRLATGRTADWLSRVPGTFGGQQALARTLVQAVFAAGLTTTAATSAAPWIAHAEAAAAAMPVPVADPEPAAVPAPQQVSTLDRKTVMRVDAQRGDTLWSIAEAHLGAGERWREIAELNDGRRMADGSTFHDASRIQPGWTILVPSAKVVTQTHVVVTPGDTLWELAEEAYGEGEEWPRIYRANRAKIDEPHWIYPGQRFVVPGQRETEQPLVVKPGEQPSRPIDPPTSTAEPTPPPAESPSITEEVEQQPDPGTKTNTDESDLHIDGATIARALLGGGGFLAAGMLAVYAGRRLTQSRNRRSGRVRPSIPEHLVAEEKALRVVGSSSSRLAAFFDAALKELAQRIEERGFDLPEVTAACIDGDRLDLHLSAPTDAVPEPWLASPDGLVWRTSLTHVPVALDRLSPYPTMVTLGTDDSGATWFIDLEAAGFLQVVGDQDVAADVVRFLAAELALNPWTVADMVSVTGIAEDVVALNHGRLYPDPKVRIADLAKSAKRMNEITESSGRGVLASRVIDGGVNSWMPVIALARIAGHDVAAAAEVEDFLDEMERADGRTATALVALTSEPLSDRGVTLRANGNGTLDTPWAELRANRLTTAEAATLSELFENADAEGDEPIPVATRSDGEPAGTDLAGSLVDELTESRCGTGDPDSVLPRPDRHYVEAAATTVEDLATLAPAVPPREETRVIAADPTLDADLADWLDPTTTRPKLRVLGPIELRAVGERSKELESRPAYFAELAAFLACHPAGATPSQAADAFGLQHNSLHTRIGSLRKWLGQTGSADWYLPEARRIRGVAVYQLDGVLVDADLFRRLRARGEARGPEGIDDFRRALDLVGGKPFDQQRTAGYGWLVDTPEDHYLTAAIVDVAHVVATHALAERKPSLAVWAAEKAIASAPSEDKPRLDLARAKQAIGDTDGAERYLNREVFNRSDDDRAPLDPSERTVHVVDQFGRQSSR